MTVEEKKNRKRNYVTVLIVMIILNVIFARSFYWPNMKGYFKRIVAEIVLIILGIGAVPYLMVRIPSLNRWVSQRIEAVRNIWAVLWERRCRTLCIAALYILFGLLGYDLAKIPYILGRTDRFNPRMALIVIACLYLALTFFLMRRICAKRADLLLLAVVMIIGITYIRVTPGEIATAWDDETHYMRTISLSNELNGIMYSSDKLLLSGVGVDPVRFSREEQKEYAETLQKMYDERQYRYYVYTEVSLWSVAYIPGAVGITIGRGLGLPYLEILKLGRFCNLLFYALVVAAAVKKIKYGKALLACFGLIPSAVFLACSYSYDYWVLCLGIYGYAVFFSILQDAEHTIKKRDVFAMLFALLLGFIPKMVYFPLLFPLLFIPKSRFSSRKQQKWFRIAVIVVVLLLFASFFCGFWQPDTRGGADVDSVGQVKFILGNIGKYASILYHFLVPWYLSPVTVNQYFLAYAYPGWGTSNCILITILYILAFIDRGDAPQKGIGAVRITGLIGAALATMIVPTALYISFTPVAADTIAGCQPRYLFPVLLPFFLFIGADKVAYRGEKKLITTLSMAVFAGTFLRDITRLIVLLY